MTKATEAHRALSEALSEAPAACAGDDRFVDDDIAAAELAGICRSCPLYTPCEQYARTAKPLGGVWAGKRWHRVTRGTTKGAA